MSSPSSYSKLVDWEASEQEPSAPALPTPYSSSSSSSSSASYGSAAVGSSMRQRAEDKEVGAQMVSLGNRIVNSNNNSSRGISSESAFASGPPPEGLYSVPADDADALTCRICLDSDTRSNLIAPCACAGTSRWVHRNCLDQWRATREDVAFKQCTECKKPYVLMSRTQESFKSNCQRYSRFSILFCQDLLAPLLLASTWLALISLIVFGFDSRSHKLIEAFKFTTRPATFYFLCGLGITFSIVGIIAMVMLCTGSAPSGCGDGCNGCGDCCYICCSRSHVAPIWVGPGDSCVACCNGCTCDCCTSGAACSGGDCCAGAALGEEAIAILLVLVVVLAAIGLLVSVVVGVWYTNQILQRHLHIISKKTMTKDLIVKDLAEGAINPTLEFEMHEIIPESSERSESSAEAIGVQIMNRV